MKIWVKIENLINVKNLCLIENKEVIRVLRVKYNANEMNKTH